jgi:flagellar basal body rod protein FlgG
MNAIEIAAIGLQQDSERLKLISHNVANISTPGFKRQYAVQGAAFANTVDAERRAQTGLTVHTDTRAGKLSATGNPLDVALAADEFLMVRMADGSTALTRGTSLHTDATGRLLTLSGLAIQGLSGDMTVPRTAQQVRIDAAGNVLADDVLVGSLSIAKVATPAALEFMGDGLYRAGADTGLQMTKTMGLRTGHLESSNVQTTQEMVQMMTTMRHAETMSKLIQGADDMLDKAIRKFGEL